jgi:uncharacterized membrane protein YhaH (DUF805 family)
MYCSNCGTQNTDSAQFCSGCGNPTTNQTVNSGIRTSGSGSNSSNPFVQFGRAFSKYVEFTGRARRKEYWLFTLVNSLINFFFLVAFSGDDSIIPYFLYCLATFLPSLAIGIRRMHDVGKSGWYYVIPLYNYILAGTDGNSGSNQYGPDPKA